MEEDCENDKIVEMDYENYRIVVVVVAAAAVVVVVAVDWMMTEK